MSNQTQAQLMQELVHLLEVYGADKNRWPAADRLKLSGFVASSAEARQAVAQAAALDQLLDLAPSVSLARERALAQRIVAAAASANFGASGDGPPSHKGPPSNIVPLPTARKSAKPFSTGQARQAAGLLLAASLMLGLFVGTTGQMTPVYDTITDAIGLPDDEPELALFSGAASAGEEAL